VWKNREECRGFVLGIHILDKLQTDNDVGKLSLWPFRIKQHSNSFKNPNLLRYDTASKCSLILMFWSSWGFTSSGLWCRINGASDPDIL